MNRKEFLRLVSIGVPAGILLPSFLESCRKKELFDGKTYGGKVIIIGGGAAGLYAAFLLLKHNVDVTIFEAQGRYGGRIFPLNGFSDFPIELGAEECHGQRSIWYDMISSTPGISFVDTEVEEDYIMIDGSLKSLSSLSSDPDITAANNLSDNLGTTNIGGDITADQYLQQNNYSNRTHTYLDALFGNEWGTSNDRLGLQGASDEDKLWTSGDVNFYLKNHSFLSILEEKMPEVFAHIQLNTQIQNIDYSGSKIVLTDQVNNIYTADKIIITVPLPILRDGDITFVPPLDSVRTNAFSRIGMGSGLKVILKFSTRFWADNCGSIFGNGLVPEYWAPGVGGTSVENNVLTAFVMGSYAENLLALGTGMVPAILNDLDLMFGGGVATANFVASHRWNWGMDAFTKGAYSFPIPGGSGAREIIASSIGNKIFFAGEATHTAGHNSTVHGAMETGLRAVEELFKSA